jgi:hypothetical protein|tara:strand:- start:111 stop:296 length:186 start_codon:yes stop_codon:yes gene_type:complete
MLDLVMSNLDVIISTVTGIITVASLIVAGTRTPNPDTILGKLYKVVEFASLTIGKSKDTGK